MITRVDVFYLLCSNISTRYNNLTYLSDDKTLVCLNGKLKLYYEIETHAICYRDTGHFNQSSQKYIEYAKVRRFQPF